jgi:hypothetical protein
VYKLCLAPPDNPGGCVSAQNYQIQVSVAKKYFPGQQEKPIFVCKKDLFLPKQVLFASSNFWTRRKYKPG